MNKLSKKQLAKIYGGDSGSDLSNTVQSPTPPPETSTGSDLSNTVQ